MEARSEDVNQLWDRVCFWASFWRSSLQSLEITLFRPFFMIGMQLRLKLCCLFVFVVLLFVCQSSGLLVLCVVFSLVVNKVCFLSKKDKSISLYACI